MPRKQVKTAVKAKPKPPARLTASASKPIKAQVESHKAAQGVRVTDKLAPRPEKLQAFVDCYLVTFNATLAARAAGYALSNAESAGSHLLNSGVVQDILQRRRLEATTEANVRVVDILRALMELAYLDPLECFHAVVDGKTVTVRLRDLHEMPLHVRRCIASFKVKKQNLTSNDNIIDTVIEVKFWNKPQALEILAKHKNLMTQIVEHHVTVQQFEKLTDEQLIARTADLTDRMRRHLEAKARKQLGDGNGDPENV